MALLDIRKWAVVESGRRDLVLDCVKYPDNGMNKYINAGQRMLDRLLNTDKSSGRYITILKLGSYVVDFQNFRAVQEVWVTDSSSGRRQLHKQTLEHVRKHYSVLPVVTNGPPHSYCPTIIRPGSGQDVTVLAGYDQFLPYVEDIDWTDYYAWNGILVMPPTDQDVMLEIIGLIYSEPLVKDTTETYWTLSHPEILVMATLCVLEKFNRNTEGVKDWMNAIQAELNEIDKDIVESEIAGIHKMR